MLRWSKEDGVIIFDDPRVVRLPVCRTGLALP